MKNRTDIFRKIVICILLVVISMSCFSGCNAKKGFTYWTDGTSSLAELTDYVKAVTCKNSKDFIPVKDRIAVFDLDGTLIGELAPTYLDWVLYAYRVLDDPDYQGQATEEMLETAKYIRKIPEEGIPDWLEAAHIRDTAKAFAGMTNEEFEQYFLNFLQKDAAGFENLKYADILYKPMIEVVNYLIKNDFTVFIVSGTGTHVCRIFLRDKLDIPPYQVVGSVYSVKPDGQGDLDGLEYNMTAKDVIVRDGAYQIKNVKANKIKTIWEHIGQQPVLAFGNSSGDFSMAMMTTKDNPYLSKAFFVLADDDVREYGNSEKSAEFADKVKANGWSTFSMKNDWTTIYGENVKRTTRAFN